MSLVQIYTEGDDCKFIKDYLPHIFLNFPADMVSVKDVGGWTKLSLIDNTLKSNSDSGGTNLIIFDADNNYEERRDEIRDLRQRLDVDFELFLFPNNADTGDFEILLEQIINVNHDRIIDCFERYSACLAEEGESNYQIPERKSKIYSYLMAMGVEPKPKERDYGDSECWNLDHDSLTPLREFLTNNISF